MRDIRFSTKFNTIPTDIGNGIVSEGEGIDVITLCLKSSNI